MEHGIYAIHDAPAEIFLITLIISHNDVQPVRTFSDAINNPDSVFYKHYEDYDLYQIGTIDLQGGEITPAKTPRLVAKGVDRKDQPA